MPEDLYEDAVIKIEATLREGGMLSKAYSGKLDLTYEKNGTQLSKEADIDVPKGSVKRSYTVPKVADTEENYRLKVLADYGKTKEKHKVLVDAIVWPKTVTLTVKDLKTGNPVPNLAYEVIHKSKKLKGDTDNAGKGTQNLKKAVYSIGIKAPFKLISNKNTPKKREHEVVVSSTGVAKFLAPDITQDVYKPATVGGDKKDGVRQYVNGETAQEGCDALGNIVEFEVCHKEQTKGINGDKIYIKVEFSKLSDRNSPLPALLAPCQGIASANNGKTLTGFVTLAADGGSATFKLQLGYAGGETFKVSCGYTEADVTDDKITLVTWRKLTYQMRFPNMLQPRLTQRVRDEDGTNYYDLPDSIRTLLGTRLGAVFIEYENRKSLPFADPVAGAPALVNKGFMELNADATPQYVLDGSKNWAGGATAFDATTTREITITVCDRAFSSRTKALAPTLQCTAATLETNIDTESQYIYFPKTPAAANQVNLVVNTYKWVANLTTVAADDKKRKPELETPFVAGDGGGPSKFKITDVTTGRPPITVEADEWSDLPDTEKDKIKTYYEGSFTNEKAIRQAGIKVVFQITGPTSGEFDGVTLSTINSTFNNVHAASDLKVTSHPGLDDDANPREGPMTDVTITHVNGRKMKFVLPSDAPVKPGSFAGAASATKCPVDISFSIQGTYSINGNAGSGDQILVLKDTLPGPCSSTVCHELGHSMGMSAFTPIPVPPGLTRPNHVDGGGWYYKDGVAPFSNGIRNLHAGPHCAHGMSAVNRAHAKFNSWSPGAADDVCIMWGSGGSDDNRKNYCPDCAKVLKARQLTDVRARWDTRVDG